MKKPHFIISFLKHPATIILVVLGILVVIISGMLLKKKPIEYITEKATRQTLTQEVAVTGKVKAAETLNLSFETGGRIVSVNKKVGDRVIAGEALVSLDTSELLAEERQAEAAVDVEQSKLNEIKRGSRPEEIAISETNLSNAETARENSARAVIDAIKNAYSKSDDAIRNKVDQLFDTPRLSPVLSVYIANENGPQFKIDAETMRLKLEKELTDWSSEIEKMNVQGNTSEYISSAKNYVTDVISFLDKMAFGVNKLKAVSSLTDATISGWRTDVSAGRANVSTVMIGLTTAEDGVKTAESNVISAQKELDLKKAGSTAEDIAAQEAALRSAEAKIDIYKAQIAKNYLNSPISGIVIKQEAKIGEIANPQEVITAVISEKFMEIEANIPESDIAKIKAGQDADVTLDAFGSEKIFKAKVVSIEPSETVVEGVPTYKTKFQIVTNGEQAKSGMTANITIFTDKRENAIVIPYRAVIYQNGNKSVKILTETNQNDASDATKTVSEVAVETGMRGAGSLVEVLSGVSEGDTVIISEKTTQ